MDTKHLVKLVGYKVIPYRNKNTGEPEEIRLAQCVITSENIEKGPQVIVGELMMPKHLRDTPLGDYIAEFEIAVDKTLRIGARLTNLHPIGAGAPSARPSSSKEQEKKAA
ncbi:cellulose synthase [Herbaspirillum sp. DW155]|uniref:hypothetical protein n=1 Tax=Herbaspirillum sp. DW155 TaxID=3095609 RepID=UPI003086348B|nr:cellulose synthase [Herbaspirillum sp. DW155]